MNGPEIQRLIQCLSKLPGLGPRSGRRLALHLLKKKDSLLRPLIDILQAADAAVKTCHICYQLDTSDPCRICQNVKRDPQVLCVVQDVADLWAMERASFFKGRYHVLGGVLSAMDGIGPGQLTIEALQTRLRKEPVTEIILALNPTLDGQTTIHYLIDLIRPLNIPVSVLAHGVPVGGELDYLDEGTLTLAYASRRSCA